jgi:Glycosyl hydrolases family 2/Glycosyl hydrolases family 2, TIM barrel domain
MKTTTYLLHCAIGLFGLFTLATNVGAEPVAQAFEVRYFTQNPAANGETDFKGKTEFLNTEQRVDFLRAYADYGRIFWQDPRLDKEVFPLAEARALSQQIKPQPRPQVRVRLLEDEWAWHGLPAAQTTHDETSRRAWLNASALRVADGRLYFGQTAKADCKIAPALNWRARLQLGLDVSKTQAETIVALEQGVVVGFDAQRRFFYLTEQKRVYPAATFDPASVALAVEVDFTTRRFNLKLNDALVADYVPFSDPRASSFSQLEISGAAGLSISEIYGVAYFKQDADPHYPYAVKTFIDDDFEATISTDGWEQAGYTDSAWARSALPIVHGGERQAGEALLLRKTFVVENPAAWSRALLNLETVVPSGTLYVNGKRFEVLHDPKPRQLDIRRALMPGVNVIALRVDSYFVPDAQIMTHTSTDRNTGWFSGRIHLDLLKPEALDDVHVFTSSLSDDRAEQDVEVTWHSDQAKPFSGKLRISLAPWFPREGKPVVVQELPISSISTIQNRVTHRLQVPKPDLWTAHAPHLYVARVELLDEAGAIIDDCSVTTGIRTVSQEGGTFRINGRPEILRAPLLFGCRTPLEAIARWDKCGPLENLVQELTMIQRMNGNGVRMSVHDGKNGGINDPRIAEIADQMGLMLIWQTSAWIREGTVFAMDFDLLSEDVHLVRNHPSIVIWQPANHPKWSGWDKAMVAYRRIYDAITRWDQTRLISPSADFRFLDPANDAGTLDAQGRPMKADPIWTAPLITRGNMDYICGYGNAWTALRKWPDLEKDEMPLYFDPKPFARTFLESPDRAYFNFEHDESAGQPNWSLIKGRPYYRVASYEADYDVGSIGRLLTFDEWDASQAWQALVAYESIKKMRMMDYDGFSWCCLRGGSNMATYQKSLTDYEGVAKLAFYAHGTVFQNTFAGSDDVDTVYGPADLITPVIFNLGKARSVSLTAQLLTRDGKRIESKNFGRFSLAAGRTFLRGTPFRFSHTPPDGAYVVNYVLE